MFEDASAPDGAGWLVPVEPLDLPAEPPVVLSGAVLSGAVLALRAAVRVLAEVDLSALSGPAVLAHLAEVDGRALHHLDGAPPPRAGRTATAWRPPGAPWRWPAGYGSSRLSAPRCCPAGCR